MRRIAPDASVVTSQSKITEEGTARMLIDADVVFGCTDDNGGRLVLSRLASYLLTPVIDCGVLLSSDDRGKLVGIDGRVTLLAPEALPVLSAVTALTSSVPPPRPFPPKNIHGSSTRATHLPWWA